MAELEAERGAAATYFLMTRERLLQPRLAPRASGRSRGCARSATGSACTPSGPHVDLDERFDPVLAWHNPDPEYMREPVEGVVNVMSAPWFARDATARDSNQHWRSGCPHEELARRRVRVAAAPDAPGDLGLPRRDDARDDAGDARRRARAAARAARGRQDRPLVKPLTVLVTASRRARHGGAPARAARERRARGAPRRHRHVRARRSAGTSATRSTSSRPGSDPGFADAMLEVCEREGVDAVLPQSSFDLPGLAERAGALRRHRRCSSRRPRRSAARTTRRRPTRCCDRLGVRGARRCGASAARAAVAAAARELGYPERRRLLQAGLLVGLARLPHPRPDGRPRRPAARRSGPASPWRCGSRTPSSCSRRRRDRAARDGARDRRRSGRSTGSPTAGAIAARPPEDARGDARRARDVLRDARRPGADGARGRRSSPSSGSSTSSTSSSSAST